MSLQDIDDVDGAVGEVARVLAPGGCLCLAIVHPLSSAGDFTDDSPAAPFVIDGSYMRERRTTDVMERAGLTMTFVSAHRPLGRYFAALECARPYVAGMREVVVPPDLAESDPAQQRWRRVPMFLLVRAVKPFASRP